MSVSFGKDGKLHITVCNLSIEKDYEIETVLTDAEAKAVSGEIVLAQSADPGGFRLFEPSPPAGFRCAVCIRI